MSVPPTRRAYIGLGSNLGDSMRTLCEAMNALARLSVNGRVQRSSLYRTPPWGLLEQPPFINAAAGFDTALAPRELLQALLTIEQAAGRERTGQRWGPRTLDLDFLHMHGVRCQDDCLMLPHPRIAERAFVLLPLCELDGDLQLPGFGRVADLLEAVDRSGCERLA